MISFRFIIQFILFFYFIFSLPFHFFIIFLFFFIGVGGGIEEVGSQVDSEEEEGEKEGEGEETLIRSFVRVTSDTEPFVTIVNSPEACCCTLCSLTCYCYSWWAAWHAHAASVAAP